MKAWALAVLVAVLAGVAWAANQTPANGNAPKYNKATEVKLKGTVVDVRDYNCPISGTMGAHLTLKLQDGGTIELHLAATKYVKSYEMVFNKGDEIEVIGSKVKFNGADTILAREITRGQDSFVFRDANGKPVW
jgi:DNA/RNA endonuclease YhcR with UshA esterase domain